MLLGFCRSRRGVIFESISITEARVGSGGLCWVDIR